MGENGVVQLEVSNVDIYIEWYIKDAFQQVEVLALATNNGSSGVTQTEYIAELCDC